MVFITSQISMINLAAAAASKHATQVKQLNVTAVIKRPRFPRKP